MKKDNSENIKDFLIKHLNYTPRRLLFEEFEIKKQSFIVENKIKNDNLEKMAVRQNFNFNFLKNLKKFRQDYPLECMSEVNLRNHSHKIKNDHLYIQHDCIHQYQLNKRLIPVPVKPDKNGMSLCLICNELSKSYEGPNSVLNGSRSIAKEKKILTLGVGNKENTDIQIKVSLYENTFALTQQKIKT